MAFLVTRTVRTGPICGSFLHRASPLSAACAVQQCSYGTDSSSSSRMRFTGMRQNKEYAFAAITTVVGAAAFFSALRAGSSRPVHLEAGKGGGLDPNGWQQLKLTHSEQLNHNTKKFRFALEDPDAVSGLSVASCLLTRAPIGDADKDGKPSFVMRPYTPVTSPDVKGYFELVIKVYPQGKMTQHMAALSEGQTLEVKGPIPKIPYSPNMKKKIGMIAGGTGITPMYQVIDAILSNPADMTQVSLLYANTTPDDILLKKELDKMAEIYPNFKVYYVVSHPTDDWNGGVGFVDHDKIVKGLPAPADDTMILVCGPPGMMNAISGDKISPKDQGPLKGALNEAGYSAEQVFKF